jgi:hypothetical protein
VPGVDSDLRVILTSAHSEESMLDLIYLLGAVALFGLVALIARGVEKL